ncbi:hypothetical protein QJS66_22685 [Kocuria rhizophila]|nr:hypothetical protein QJS66_22685 [Kocuria rhizophila]
MHVVTVNDYLAEYQANLMGRVYRFWAGDRGDPGGQRNPRRRQQYAADITYGTNNEFGFDYLREQHGVDQGRARPAGHHFAIVDEVHSILIDEARTRSSSPALPRGRPTAGTASSRPW